MSNAPENEELHYCPVCLKGYKRREHLQRHRTTHNADRPYCCNTCDAAFKRTDILRRHMETCDGKRAQQGIATRKRRACDRCVRQKKACNSSSPCQNCQKRGVSCQYSYLGCAAGPSRPTTEAADAPAATDDGRTLSGTPWPVDNAADNASAADSMVGDAPSDPASQVVPFHYEDDWTALVHDTASDLGFLNSHVADMIDQEWPMFMSDTYGTTSQLRPARREAYQSDAPYHGYTFHFLADFTSRTGLVSSFDCGTVAQRREVVSSYFQALEGTDTTGPPASSPESGEFLVEFQDPCEDVASYSAEWESWLDNPMVVKLQQIILRIKEVVVIKPRNSTVTLSWSPALEARCLDFFSLSRFGKFLELYWSVWHPNVNFLHRPTFDPTNTPSTLLAAMATIGKVPFELSNVYPACANSSARCLRVAGQQGQRGCETVV